jgi:uncharacterized membrane protein YhhN
VTGHERGSRLTPFEGAYLALTVAQLAGEGLDLQPLVWATKPLLMPVLSAWVWKETSSRPTATTQALLVALVFSFLGDVFLMIPADLFLWGLGSFLVGHVAYIVAFWSGPSGARRPRVLPPGTIALTFPIHLYAAGIVAFLLPYLGDFTVPVLVYMAVIVIMGLSSVFRRGRVSPRSFWPVYAGAISFIVSDSVIALDRFVAPVPYRGVLVMGAYLLAQCWITRGLLVEHRERAASP